MKLSIRARLTFAAVVVFAMLLMLFTSVVYWLLAASMEAKLREDSLHDMRVLVDYLSGPHWQSELAEMPDESQEFRLLIKIVDSDGKLVVLGGDVKPFDWPTDFAAIKTSAEADTVQWEHHEIKGTEHLILTRSFVPPGASVHYLQIANSEADKKWILDAFITHANVGSFLLLIIAILACYFFSKKALEPVELIRLRAETINSDNLSDRLSYDGPPDELFRLTQTLNGMLGRVENTVAKMKQFVADASHELRIPLTGLRGTLEVAMRQKRSVEQYISVLDTVHKESERLSELVWNLLSLARADTGEMALEPTDVSLEPFLKMVFEEAETLNTDEKVRLILGPIPAETARFDEAKIHQLLINLIENAIRYNRPGGDVTLSAKRTASGLEISVKDTGIGIAVDELAKIFDRFYRVDKARSREIGGTGLGLAIARSIAEAHHGKLTVTSVLGQGSEFVLSLPRR